MCLCLTDCQSSGSQTQAASYAVAQAAVTTAYVSSYTVLYLSADIAYTSVAVSTAASYVSWAASNAAVASQVTGASAVAKATKYVASNAISAVKATTFTSAQTSSASFATSAAYTSSFDYVYSYASASSSNVIQAVAVVAPQISYFAGNQQMINQFVTNINVVTTVVPPAPAGEFTKFALHYVAVDCLPLSDSACTASLSPIQTNAASIRNCKICS